MPGSLRRADAGVIPSRHRQLWFRSVQVLAHPSFLSFPQKTVFVAPTSYL